MFNAEERKRAETVMQKLSSSTRNLTTTKIRKLLSMANDIYNEAILLDDWTPALQSKIEYFIVRMAYESGRERDVKSFIAETDLMGRAQKVKSRQEFLDFHKYLEALVAYHRFYGGKD